MRVMTMSRVSTGIRRCGVRHGPEMQEWPNGTFTDEEVRILLEDPDLVVAFAEEEEATGEEDTADRPAKGSKGGTRARARDSVKPEESTGEQGEAPPSLGTTPAVAEA